MKSPAVLLLSPGIIKWTDADFGLPHLVSLGGVLREQTGVRVEILDLGYESGDRADLQRTLDDLGPYLLIGLSCYSSFDYRRTLSLAGWLKTRFHDVPIVVGGYHGSALPHDLVFDGSPVTAVVTGEGEHALAGMVRSLLGGASLDPGVVAGGVVQDLDSLPPMQWDLLDRYWPKATSIGRKLQLNLSRGCPYRCTFCMERAKTGYAWRAYSAERAVDELHRLDRAARLDRWVVNITDPIFGFKRSWRRQVLEGIIERGLQPRQFWTLTRSDDLEDVDVALLARARFSIGIGLESGSPRMLRLMQKAGGPERYLDALRRLARLSRKHGLSWAGNLVVGHPGETLESLHETLDFVREIFAEAERTCGWFSVDPFRLYPGSDVHVSVERWERDHGARFYHKDWWKRWYDGAFCAQHLDPSAELSYEQRVGFMYEHYPPLVEAVHQRFVGQGREVDRVFRSSIAEQRELMSTTSRDRLLRKARRAEGTPQLAVPIGLQVRNPWARRREEAVRRLLDNGVLRSAGLVEALLALGPEAHMHHEAAQAMLLDRPVAPAVEGELPMALGISTIALGLEALAPVAGEHVADLTARTGYVGALLARLVGPEGKVTAGVPKQPCDGLWIGAAMPRFPPALRRLLRPGGRAIAFLGPRFLAQDMVCLTEDGERLLTRTQVPVLGGPYGWVPRPEPRRAGVRFERRPAAALCAHVLAHLDLGADAANTFDPNLPDKPWVAPLRAAYAASPQRLALQGLGLVSHGVSELVASLRADSSELSARFADALAAEADHVPAWGEPPGEEILDVLGRLRAVLWAQQPGPDPELVVLDCPALGKAGRAMTSTEGRLVAVSLGEPSEHVLLQVLHEEMHAVTDPIVRADPEGVRDTRLGQPGYELHTELEGVAIGATQAVLEAHAPDWLPAFERWCARFG